MLKAKHIFYYPCNLPYTVTGPYTVCKAPRPRLDFPTGVRLSVLHCKLNASGSLEEESHPMPGSISQRNMPGSLAEQETAGGQANGKTRRPLTSKTPGSHLRS